MSVSRVFSALDGAHLDGSIFDVSLDGTRPDEKTETDRATRLGSSQKPVWLRRAYLAPSAVKQTANTAGPDAGL